MDSSGLANKEIYFWLCKSLSGAPGVCITFWFDAPSRINMLSFLSTSMKRFSGLGEDFVFTCTSLAVTSVLG